MKIDRVTLEARGIAEPLQFDARRGFSDYKAIREVVERRAYARHNFTPRPGETWLDLGANVGAFSVWAAAHGADVIAFEPEPECLSWAQRNVELNALGHHVTFIHGAVLVAPPVTLATMPLSVNGARGNVWRSSLFKGWQGGTWIDVPVVDVVPYWTPDVCVKMDIEGAEMPILEALAHHPVRRLVFEWSFDIDTSLARFRNVMDRLATTYTNIKGVPHSRTDQGSTPDDQWHMLGPANSAMIYCWND